MADETKTMQSEQITLVSCDEIKFTLSKQAAALISNLVSKVNEGDPDVSEIPISGVKGCTLKLVVEYMEHHNGKEGPILNTKFRKEHCDDAWDGEFIERVGQDVNELNKLISACQYLDCKVLSHLLLAKFAQFMKCRFSNRDIANILVQDAHKRRKVVL